MGDKLSPDEVIVKALGDKTPVADGEEAIQRVFEVTDGQGVSRTVEFLGPVAANKFIDGLEQ